MMLNSKKVVMTRTDPYRCAFFLSGFFQYYFSFPQYYGIKVQEDFVYRLSSLSCMWSQLTSLRSKFFSVNRTSQLLSIFCWYGFPKNDGHAWHRLPMICPINVNILYTIHSTVPWQARPVSFCLIRIQVKRNIRSSNRLHSSMVSLQQSPLGSWEKKHWHWNCGCMPVCACVKEFCQWCKSWYIYTIVQTTRTIYLYKISQAQAQKKGLQCKRFLLAISNASNGFQKYWLSLLSESKARTLMHYVCIHTCHPVPIIVVKWMNKLISFGGMQQHNVLISKNNNTSEHPLWQCECCCIVAL